VHSAITVAQVIWIMLLLADSTLLRAAAAVTFAVCSWAARTLT
jgi:hypothetical protein